MAARGAASNEEAAGEGPLAAQQHEGAALVAAVIDNRAGEVGLAVLDAASGTLLLAQHVEETRTFARTLYAHFGLQALPLLPCMAPCACLLAAAAKPLGLRPLAC